MEQGVGRSSVLAQFTEKTVRLLDLFRGKRRLDGLPTQQVTGRRGEEDAYFYLRRQVTQWPARNYGSPWRRGEIDLIGWMEKYCVLSRSRREPRAR